MHIANFTPDEIQYTHVGLHGTIVPEQIIEVDQQKGNHILNKFGERGLLQLKLGDDSPERLEELKSLAMKLYTKFWVKNVSNHNQLNEIRKNESKGFLLASEKVAEKAEELGIQLLAPWKLAPPAEKKELEAYKAKLDGQAEEIRAMKEMVNQLVAAVTSQNTQPVPAPEDPLEQYMKQFRGRGKAQLKVWARLNEEAIMDWPQEALNELQIKWVGTYGENPGKEDEKYPF